MILLDTGFLYALNDVDDANHPRAVTFLRSLAEAELGLPYLDPLFIHFSQKLNDLVF